MAKRRRRGRAGDEGRAERRSQTQAFAAFVADQQGVTGGGSAQPVDRAGNLPGVQLNDPDETAEAGVHDFPIQPQHRGWGQ